MKGMDYKTKEYYKRKLQNEKEKRFNANLLSFPDLDGEEWRWAVGLEGKYKVSNLGRVRSYIKGGRIKSPNKTKCGYLVVNLFYDCGLHGKLVHRLVAEAFIPNPENKRTVNHKNGKKDDNRAVNLEWMTYSENVKHAFDTGLKKDTDKQKASVSQWKKFPPEVINEMRRLWAEGNISQHAIARMFNADPSHVCRIVNNKQRVNDELVLFYKQENKRMLAEKNGLKP